MDVDSFDGSSPDDFWRLKLEEAQRHYGETRTEESRAEYRRVLRVFADLVLWGQMPPPLE
jgi:hypothetical protein